MRPPYDEYDRAIMPPYIIQSGLRESIAILEEEIDKIRSNIKAYFNEV
jgi:hypothetical protein